MVLIIISEFAANTPGDDIKVIYHNSPILDDQAIQDIVTPTFMGLYSAGGKEPEEKHGSIPLEKERTAIAWSIITSDVTRLIIIVVANSEVSEVQKSLNTDPVQSKLGELRSLLKQDNLDEKIIERRSMQFVSDLDIVDDASRISRVFGEEI